MKRSIVLFAILITAIFFYPVFAHADKLGRYLAANPISEPLALLAIGSGLLTVAGLVKRITEPS